jgi:leucyl/phenylalanyl-tRNA--protein transferase
MEPWDLGDPRKGPRRRPLRTGGDLSPERLIRAYRNGVFPWETGPEGPTWWSPDPRCVLLTKDWEPPRGLARTLRKPGWEVSFDQDFTSVVAACARASRPGQAGTWITPEFQQAYGELHRRGHAHSVEVRQGGILVGGLYGMQVGRLFCGESMFHLVTDASKVAFASLVVRLRGHGVPLVDCQAPTPHLMSLGAVVAHRDDFLDAVEALRDAGPLPGLWPVSPGRA